MRKIIFMNCLLVCLFTACTSLPGPTEEDDALVIGSFVFDYPDDFFNMPPRTIKNHIYLTFVNSTTGDVRKVKTLDGYFQFAANGSDTYLLQSVETELKRGNTRYITGSGISVKFPIREESVCYLGHWSLVYSNPERVSSKHTSTGKQTTFYNYEKSLHVEYSAGEIQSHIQGLDSESEWLRYEITTVEPVQ